MSKEAMKLALEALEYIYNGANNQGPHTGISWRCVSNKAEPVITALRKALAEPDFWEGYVPEPVKPATEESSATQAQQALDKKAENARELGLDYEPAQRTWVGLDQLEIDAWFLDSTALTLEAGRKIAQAIEAKLKEKNT